MRLAAAFFLGAMAATVAHAAIQVTYSDPGRFTDKAGGLTAAEAALRSLTKRLESLGTRLPLGQYLRVEFLDLDLVGASHRSLLRSAQGG
jgi:hypothetical protein